MFRRHKLLVTCLFMVLLICYIYSGNSAPTSRNSRVEFGEKFTGNTHNSLFHTCPLPNIDPWDSERMKYFDPSYDPLKDCIPKHGKLTELHNGRLIVKKDNITCWGRCVNRKNYAKNELGPVHYTTEDHVFECDIVAAYCQEMNNPSETFHIALHTQVVEKKPAVTKKPLHKQYNVYIVLLDSTASSQAERNMPKSMTYLRDSMGAVTFPYLNKIGLNSRPNGFALIYGKRLESQDRLLFQQRKLEAEWDIDDTCDKYLDDENSIFHEFRNHGYKTALIEDMGDGIMNYKYCLGWENPPLDHSSHPLGKIRTRYPMNDELRKLTEPHINCIEDFTYELDYMGQFINAYVDSPKFGFMWDTSIGHDLEGGTVRFDKHLLAFLQKHRKKLDESFVIFTGDHGLRIGKTTQTEWGVLDGNNPFLTISVPAELRNNSELMATLRENSQKLQTHFDTRATILDILKYQPLAKFQDREWKQLGDEKGSSYLRRMAGDRTCATLPIPIEYCICQFPKETLDSKSSLAAQLGEAMTDAVNRQLVEGGVAWKCAKWRLKEVLSIVAFRPHNETETYQVQIATAVPNEAIFQGFVMRLSASSFHVTAVDRKDEYRSRGDCVYYHLESKCDCQHFLLNFVSKSTLRRFDEVFKRKPKSFHKRI